ncbi:MAG TPA: DEAD/DEAH box helicase [Chitinispirillaceae bacterium]|nr:DEAD/DEAH box helicase [Chitinispirillaceae bacterium]
MNNDFKNILSPFHPLIQHWFESRFQTPTDIQSKAWPVISQGEHALVCAPTGTGKTLTAFLWAINQLITGQWEEGQTHVLYISPLKALNTDIKENLLVPLKEIRHLFTEHGQQFPSVRIITRSGDTPLAERRAMIQRPPSILITTPESLNLIISSPRARSILKDLKTVILDEVHAVAHDKRGALLSLSIERCVRLSGEFQRIALSATIRPAEVAARFAGGYKLVMDKTGAAVYEPRLVHILISDQQKQVHLSVKGLHHDKMTIGETDTVWRSLAAQCDEIILRNRATLIFVNNRRLAERIVLYINNLHETPCVYSHHGSLSRELRQEVEHRLKSGNLKAIVATSSLEMGIDIGDIDEVVLVQAPVSVASSLQRIGRAGHSVHRISAGTFFPLFGLDILYSAIMARMTHDRDIESLKPLNNPLDILAQVVLSMCCLDTYKADELYNIIRTSAVFHTCPRRYFDCVLMMLTGKYEETRVRELHPRLTIDPETGDISGSRGMLNLVYSWGGSIPDKGYYNVKIRGSDTKIGELDEEFVFERRAGDTFLMGTQHWRIENIDEQNVEVTQWHGTASMSPFWKADALNRTFHVSSFTAEFLETWNDNIDSEEFLNELEQHCYLDAAAAESLVSYLKFQKSFTGPILPHRHHLIVEHVQESEEGIEPHTILHTMWGNCVNYPFMLALRTVWEERYHRQLVTFATNEAIFINEIVKPEELLAVTVTAINSLLRKSLERSAFFGTRFRENASRALLLPKSDPRRRIPLWITRLRSKKLLDSVRRFDDFPIMAETWRTCLQDEFDLDALTMLLDELQSGILKISTVQTTGTSPFAGSLQWKFTNQFLYEDDTPHATTESSSISDDLLNEITFSSRLRPVFSKMDIELFQQKLHRTTPGYAPSNARELLTWVDERICIPHDEWKVLIVSMYGNEKSSSDTSNQPFSNAQINDSLILQHLRIVRFPGASVDCWTTTTEIPILCRIFKTDSDTLTIRLPDGSSAPEKNSPKKNAPLNPESEGAAGFLNSTSFFSRWLSFYGPVNPSILKTTFGLNISSVKHTVSELSEQKLLVIDIAVEHESERFICDTENCERFLRIIRKKSRQQVTALPIEYLPLLIATVQGLINNHRGIEGLKVVIEQLLHCPMKAALIETDIFKTRIENYEPHLLDSLISTSDLEWFGAGKELIAFRFTGDRDITGNEPPEKKTYPEFLPEPHTRQSYFTLLQQSNLDSATFADLFWKAVWNGNLSCDSYESIRKGILVKFGKKPSPKVQKSILPDHTISRRFKPVGFDRWKATSVFPGNWYTINNVEYPEDALIEDDLHRERIRILLSRYGILFRELLFNELPVFQWSSIFRTLRIMELSGEVLTGHFFEGIPGLQFINHSTYGLLKGTLNTDVFFWINATDPASLCSVPLQSIKSTLPPRLPSTSLIYHGIQLIVISYKNGRELECRFSGNDPDVITIFQYLSQLAQSGVSPMSSRKIEIINGKSVFESEFAECFLKAGFVREYKSIVWG